MDSPTFVSSQIELASTLVCPKLPKELESQEAAANAHSSLESRIKGGLPLLLKVNEKEKTDMITHRGKTRIRAKWTGDLNDTLASLTVAAQAGHPGFVGEWKTVVHQAFIHMSLVKLHTCLPGFQVRGSLPMYTSLTDARGDFIKGYMDMHDTFIQLFEVHYLPWARKANLSEAAKDEMKATIMKTVLEIDPKATDAQLEACIREIIAPDAVFGPDSSEAAKEVHEALKLELQPVEQADHAFAQMVSSCRETWLLEQWAVLKNLKETIRNGAEVYPSLHKHFRFRDDGSLYQDVKQKRPPRRRNKETEGGSSKRARIEGE